MSKIKMLFDLKLPIENLVHRAVLSSNGGSGVFNEGFDQKVCAVVADEGLCKDFQSLKYRGEGDLLIAPVV